MNVIRTLSLLFLLFPSPWLYSASETSILPKDNTLDVHISRSCGCCGDWVDGLTEQGMSAVIHSSNALEKIKDSYGVPLDARSCQTSLSQSGYLFEGNIPAAIVKEFLANPPANAKGLVAPLPSATSIGINMQSMPFSILQLNMDGSVSPYVEVVE
ncbi:DUF411 domain-containing protein [Marinomonas ostreistagni]|uniref:DUF411 domain-containing protein n=1 Tax=Marinomonas ostreistagni TaxID=359209 RepID=A0ABS0ZE01_9GAMM|nr:DUF411 domain-containing protein [Marinomonas ostreistagni]MBJ7551915.1 DUF411 domain-containing protein [Marinomonas ostreistagni]